MDGRPDIKASKPGVSRTIVERAGRGSIMWQRTDKQRGTRPHPTGKPDSFAVGSCLKLKSGEVSCVEVESKSAVIAMAKYRSIQNVDRFIIKAFYYRASEI